MIHDSHKSIQKIKIHSRPIKISKGSKNKISLSNGVEKSPNEFLSLNNRGLTNLPEQIENKETLSKVETLELMNNHIYKLPKSLIWCKKLRILDLSNNCISKINKGLKEAKNLHYLNLSQNYLKEFSDNDVSCLRHLRTLILSKNEILTITQKISFIDNLKVLYLDGNPFQKLPCSLIMFRKIKEMKLDWCFYLDPPLDPLIRAISNPKNSIYEFTPQNKDHSENNVLSFKDLFKFIQKSQDYFFIDEFIHNFSKAKGSLISEEKLTRAISQDDKGVALYMINKMIKRNIPFSRDYNHLRNTLIGNQKTLALNLITKGYRIDQKMTERGETTLHLATKIFSIKIITALLKRKETQVDAKDDFGNTALHYLFCRSIGKTGYQNISRERGHHSTQLKNPFSGSQIHSFQTHNFVIHNRKKNQFTLLSSNYQKDDELKNISSEYKHHFRKLLNIILSLLRKGADPNIKNVMKIAPWQILIQKEMFKLFMIFRKAKCMEFLKINWSLNYGVEDKSMLHATAGITNYGFFLEFLENLNVSPIQLDNNCKTVFEYLVGVKYKLQHKIFHRYFNKTLIKYFKIENSSEPPITVRKFKEARLKLSDSKVMKHRKTRSMNMNDSHNYESRIYPEYKLPEDGTGQETLREKIVQKMMHFQPKIGLKGYNSPSSQKYYGNTDYEEEIDDSDIGSKMVNIEESTIKGASKAKIGLWGSFMYHKPQYKPKLGISDYSKSRKRSLTPYGNKQRRISQMETQPDSEKNRTQNLTQNQLASDSIVNIGSRYEYGHLQMPSTHIYSTNQLIKSKKQMMPKMKQETHDFLTARERPSTHKSISIPHLKTMKQYNSSDYSKPQIYNLRELERLSENLSKLIHSDVCQLKTFISQKQKLNQYRFVCEMRLVLSKIHFKISKFIVILSKDQLNEFFEFLQSITSLHKHIKIIKKILKVNNGGKLSRSLKEPIFNQIQKIGSMFQTLYMREGKISPKKDEQTFNFFSEPSPKKNSSDFGIQVLKNLRSPRHPPKIIMSKPHFNNLPGAYKSKSVPKFKPKFNTNQSSAFQKEGVRMSVDDDIDPEDDYSLAEDDDTIYELEDSYIKKLNDNGITDIIRKRHPVLDQNSLSINESAKMSMYRSSRHSNWNFESEKNLIKENVEYTQEEIGRNMIPTYGIGENRAIFRRKF